MNNQNAFKKSRFAHWLGIFVFQSICIIALFLIENEQIKKEFALTNFRIHEKKISDMGQWWFLFCLLVTLLNVSCTNSPKQSKTDTRNSAHKDTIRRKPSSSFLDTLTIDFPAAVFYSPDSLQLEKIKSVTDPGVFDGSMHEFYSLQRNAHTVIKKNNPRLKIIEAKKVRYLLFIRADKNLACIDLDTNYDAYGLFVFDRKKPPRLLDMANIDTELWFYFTE